MNYKKPFYLLKINTEFTRSVIYINGCLLDYNSKGFPVNVEYPINHYLKPGKNTIEIQIIESLNHESKTKGLLKSGKINCELSVVDYDKPDSDKVKIANFIYSAKDLPVAGDFVKHQTMDQLLATVSASSQQGRLNIEDNKAIQSDDGTIGIFKAEADYVKPKYGGLFASFVFPVELPVPFPEPAFFSAEDRVLESEMDDDQYKMFSQELMKELQPIWDLVNQNKIQALAPYLEARSLEYDLAFYKEPGESLRSLLAAIQDTYNDKNWTLHPLDEVEIGIDVFLNRKVAYSATDPLNHCLRFLDDNNLQTEYPIYWSKFNGQWKIVR